MTKELEHSGAAFSSCGRYRYSLWRQWNSAHPAATFIMLNPSTADAHTDDATIRRCFGFAIRYGFGGLHVVNLYALRATDPRELASTPDPVGPDNDRFIDKAVRNSRALICAWGSTAARPASIAARIAKLRNAASRHSRSLCCLGTTQSGDPAHPSRLPYSADLALPTWPTGHEAAFGVCGRCKHLLYGPIETRHNGHCGACGALIFGTPTQCPECGDSKLPAEPRRQRGAR